MLFQVALAALLVPFTSAAAAPRVTLKNGTYQGYHLPKYGQDVYLGMPYAQPPVGQLRFREPQSLNTTWSGVKPATKYGNICMQYTTAPNYAPMSEDCLSINVVVPTKVKKSKGLPVAVWIHGGGIFSGGSASPDQNLTNFVYQSTLAGNPVLGVSINYRLTAFGFLWGSPELTKKGSANNGLRDQRLALRWIQENIAKFGGDPRKATIFGASSGGLSVGKQLIAYGGRDDGLFRGAIMQSGGMAEKWPYNVANSKAYMEGLYKNLTETTGCSTEKSPLECLRRLPVAKLSKALNVTNTPVYPGSGLGPWLTVVDGDFLQDGPTESLEKRHFNKHVTIMYSTLTDEATVFQFAGPINTDKEFAAAVATAGADEKTVRTIELLYPNINGVGLPADFYADAAESKSLGTQYKRAVAFLTDAVETCSRRLTLDTWAAAGATAYSARLQLVNLVYPKSLGAHHGADMPYIFNNVEGPGYDSPQMQNMSILLSRTWASFVSELDPNNHGLDGYPVWPKWNTSQPVGVGSNMVFVADGKEGSGPHLELDNYRLAQTKYINTLWKSQLNYY
ncbi:unnamed protein product [Fusarium langsethiae]|nr:unnamed protein product [Fusarium langsethiae]